MRGWTERLSAVAAARGLVYSSSASADLIQVVSSFADLPAPRVMDWFASETGRLQLANVAWGRLGGGVCGVILVRACRSPIVVFEPIHGFARRFPPYRGSTCVRSSDLLPPRLRSSRVEVAGECISVVTQPFEFELPDQWADIDLKLDALSETFGAV